MMHDSQHYYQINIELPADLVVNCQSPAAHDQGFVIGNPQAPAACHL